MGLALCVLNYQYLVISSVSRVAKAIDLVLHVVFLSRWSLNFGRMRFDRDSLSRDRWQSTYNTTPLTCDLINPPAYIIHRHHISYVSWCE